MFRVENGEVVVEGAKDISESWLYSCSKCGCKKRLVRHLEYHHITYSPKRTSNLCAECHARITDMNRRTARRIGMKLTNSIRLEIWEQFLTEDTTPEQYYQGMLGRQAWL